MQTLLHAGFISVEEIDGVLVVGFADRQFEFSRYLMLQRALNPHDDAGVYLEHTSQGCSAYGTVVRCLLSERRLELTVDASTAESLGTETSFAIEFSYDEALLRRLRQGLERMLAGTPCAVETHEAL
jgi:hypothetical protein